MLTPEQALDIVLKSAERYIRRNPAWFVEGLVAIARQSVRSLRHYIEDPADTEVSWDTPTALLHTPANLDWSQWERTGQIGYIRVPTTAELQNHDAAIKSLMGFAQRLHESFILSEVTRSVGYIKQGDTLSLILPKGVTPTRADAEDDGKRLIERFFRPTELRQALLMTPGLTLPKTLKNVMRREMFTLRGHFGNEHPFRLRLSLSFHPLEVDVDMREANYPISITLTFDSRTLKHPGNWPKKERDRLWSILLRGLTVSGGSRRKKGDRASTNKPVSRKEFALLARVHAADAAHLEILKERVNKALSPHIVSLQPADLSIADRARDPEFMEAAVEQARLSIPEPGLVRPKVGVVVVSDGKVIASAYRGELKQGEHAEYTALQRKLPGIDLSGATVFTTLEPCTTRNAPKHPCVHWLIERKVARVVIGTIDPNRKIQGEGVLRLREAGIPVELFAHSYMAALEQLNEAFFREHRRA
jgi:pyrimidine deaminase RibD-like protein